MHSWKYYTKCRAADLPFSCEYFCLDLHSQQFEATFNSLIFTAFRRTPHSNTEKKKIIESNLKVSNLLPIKLAAGFHWNHNECHTALASRQSRLHMKALVHLKIHHSSREVTVLNPSKTFFPSHQKLLTWGHERMQAPTSFSTISNRTFHSPEIKTPVFKVLQWIKKL